MKQDQTRSSPIQKKMSVQNQKKQIIKLFQSAYINKLFNKFYLYKTYLTTTSMKKFALLQPHTEGPAITSKKNKY